MKALTHLMVYKKSLKIFLIIIFASIDLKAQLITYTSKDSIAGKPKFESSLTGRLKLNGVYDIKGNLYGNSAFVIHQNDINAPDKPGLWLDMRQSQIRFEGIQRLNNGKEIFARVEGDFESGPNNAGYFRLRQAFVRYEKLLVGQTWTTFGDDAIWPESLLDWDGPPGMVYGRRLQIRYTIDYNTNLESDIAAEMMESRRTHDYTIPDINNTINFEPRRLPDLVGTLKYKLNPGFIKIAGVYRNIGYGYQGQYKTENGYGVSAMLNLLTGNNNKNTFLLQLNYGKGIAEYTLPIGGSKLDGNVSRDDLSKLNLLPTMSGFASYQQYWNNKLHSLFILSYGEFDSKKASFEWNKMKNLYTGVNLMYNILPNLMTGAEFLWGRKTLKYDTNTEQAIASRVNFGFMYNF